MDTKLLCQIGLNESQALAYKALVQQKGARPAQVAKLIGESRSNTYAILDKLVDLGLARREDVNKKYTYLPESPQKLEALVSSQIADRQSDLERLKKRMPEMLSAYQEDRAAPKATVHAGKDAVRASYKLQTVTDDRFIRLVRSIHDIGFMGFGNMRSLRHLAANGGKRRIGITPRMTADKLLDDRSDSRTALKRSWLPEGSYTAPVEWAVSGDTTWAIIFKDQGYVVEIRNQAVADSMKQIIDLFSEELGQKYE